MSDRLPPEAFYRALFDKARDKPLHVKCKSQKEAKRLRMKLYQWRNKLLEYPELDPTLALIAPVAKLALFGKTLSVSYPELQHGNTDPRGGQA